MTAPPPIRIGVDVGGSKLEAVALSPRGEELVRRRVPTPVGDHGAAVAAIADLVRAVESELGERGTVGLGTPGSVDPVSGTLRGSNATALNGHPLGEDVAALLGCEVRIANDADCFALSEATDGAAAGRSPVFGVILGTGVGGGIVVNGELVAGATGITGEWGHNELPWRRFEDEPVVPCYCGRVGCIETYLSGRGLEREHARRSGRRRDGRTIAELATSGDGDAIDSVVIYADRLARGLASIINLIDPAVIVLGGGVSNITLLYSLVPDYWGRYVFAAEPATKLVPAAYGDSSGVRGAARLWGR